MQLKQLIKGIEPLAMAGEPGREITSLAFDSRAVGAGTLFFAVKGTQADGHDFINAAIEKGAVAVICTDANAFDSGQRSYGMVTFIQVADTAEAMGIVASNFYCNPSAKLRLVGITGTNGKTTTATLLYDLFTALGYRAGLVSTVEYRIAGRIEPSTHTTPDALRLQAMMAEMVDAGCEFCFMEVSSHSVVQHRTAGLTFAGGVFTNLTHDHLDYHGTFAEYRDAKKRFFDELPRGAFALTNADDRNGSVMVQNTRAKVTAYSVRGTGDFAARVVEMHFDGMLMEIDGVQVWVRLTGRFNAYNLLSVYATARLLGADKEEVLRELSLLKSVNGRFQHLTLPRGITAIVDYAHTPDALQNILQSIDEIRGATGRLITVVGCGGNRDTEKRPVMARIAAAGSDMLILTSDNPRYEDPAEIIAQMREGLSPADKHLAITDRREAIRTACALAQDGDIILVAGKGHETYQDTAGVKTHFDDREEIYEAFNIKDDAPPHS